MAQLIVLGLIPGTNYQFTFNQFMAVALLGLSGYMIQRLYKQETALAKSPKKIRSNNKKTGLSQRILTYLKNAKRISPEVA